MSVRLSVCQPRLGGNVIFSAPYLDIAPILFVHIPLINEHLFCKYVNMLQKALLLMDVFILILVAQLLYNYKYLYVCLKRLRGNVIFLAFNQDLQIILLVKIPLTNVHLAYYLLYALVFTSNL